MNRRSHVFHVEVVLTGSSDWFGPALEAARESLDDIHNTGGVGDESGRFEHSSWEVCGPNEVPMYTEDVQARWDAARADIDSMMQRAPAKDRDALLRVRQFIDDLASALPSRDAS